MMTMNEKVELIQITKIQNLILLFSRKILHLKSLFISQSMKMRKAFGKLMLCLSLIEDIFRLTCDYACMCVIDFHLKRNSRLSSPNCDFGFDVQQLFYLLGNNRRDEQ
jgi:hypothetical protein